jgi:murein DD-endopeptidase MepM/ murein hydrolase activator NlpD
MVMIDHGTSYTTLYAHLSSILVKCGQNVVQGARIALAGSTGNSTGPHLHFEVRQNGAFLNPWFVLP